MALSAFDRKFGNDYLRSVPPEPGTYRFLDDAGKTLYVGKAVNLRRRLSQYRLAGKGKKDRKMRQIVRLAARIEWEVATTELDALLRENELIQTLRPGKNVAGAYSFRYPFVGFKSDGKHLYFALSSRAERLGDFRWFGVFRSRYIVGEAFFALTRLLPHLGHPIPRREVQAEGAYVFGFRRVTIPPELWEAFFRGASAELLEVLSLALLEKAAARASAEEIQEDLRALRRLWKEECLPLAEAIAATGFPSYPVSQSDRDPLFLKWRSRTPKSL